MAQGGSHLSPISGVDFLGMKFGIQSRSWGHSVAAIPKDCPILDAPMTGIVFWFLFFQRCVLILTEGGSGKGGPGNLGFPRDMGTCGISSLFQPH